MTKHILAIDDDKLILKIIDDILSSAGYRVSTADDVVYCNNIIYGNSPPDLILMDLNLPLMTGDRKIEIIRKRSKSSQIPVILVSSISEPELHKITEECGANGYLLKPFDDLNLLAVVEQGLSN